MEIKQAFFCFYLKSSKDKAIELDFIYGSLVTNGNQTTFTPLDGQQRLTTLFLLHWYLAVKENRIFEFREAIVFNEKAKFSYETRISSRDFCDALISNDVDFSNITEQLSDVIKDSSWFFSSWEKDPTIKSMLVVTDDIHKLFFDAEGFYEKLVSDDNPIISFQFIELQNFGLTDSLYVKMNSRGKELTEFENFKAKFEQYLDKFDKENGTNFTIPFSKKIDTDWTDLFWNYRDESTNVFDAELMNFIRVLVTNNHASRNTVYEIQIKVLPILTDRSKKLSFNQYEKANLLDKKCLEDIIYTLDYLKNGSEKVKTFLDDKNLIDESEIFEKALQNDLSRDERVIFFAYYKYLITNKGDIKGLYDWIRIIRNLAVNTFYNEIIDYLRSIRTVEKMLPNSANILNSLSNPKYFFIGFATEQILEERIKSILILKSDEWREAIIKFENHPYFKGQIDFLLKFSGVKDYYNSNKNLNWSNDENTKFFELFNEYGNKAEVMFNEKGHNDFGEYLWQRALLTKGDYTVDNKSNKCFVIDGFDRDISWKRFLRDDNRKRNYLTLLFDEINIETVKEDLHRIIAEDDSNDWRKYFIQRPQILGECGINKYIRFHYEYSALEKILLLERKQTNGVHREYYSFALKIELENLGNRVAYLHPTNSVWESSFIYSINGKSVRIEYSYNGNNYRLKLESEKEIIEFKSEQEVITYLFENNFINKKSE